MKGQKETIEAVAGLARSAGASCSFEQLSGGHLAAVIGFDGRTRNVILSSTTHDRNECHIAKTVRQGHASLTGGSVITSKRRRPPAAVFKLLARRRNFASETLLGVTIA
jgi:hypothetical protein